MGTSPLVSWVLGVSIALAGADGAASETRSARPVVEAGAAGVTEPDAGARHGALTQDAETKGEENGGTAAGRRSGGTSFLGMRAREPGTAAAPSFGEDRDDGEAARQRERLLRHGLELSALTAFLLFLLRRRPVRVPPPARRRQPASVSGFIW